MRKQRYLILLLLFLSHALAAQRVLYSPVVERGSVLRFMVAGKVGDNYWVQTEKRKRRIPRNAEEWMKEEQAFSIYDSRLQLQYTLPAASLTGSTLKKYLVCGNRFFDELIIQANLRQTVLRLRRYTADGILLADSSIAHFPFAEPGHRFIMAASADKSKHLLLGFESVPDATPRLHAIVFDDNFHIISSLVYEHPFITQPFIQDDFFCLPASDFNNAPVQLANNGQWLMASPARTSHNFLLFHFNGSNRELAYKEIILPPLYKMEDIALLLNNDKGEATAGILSRYRQTQHKNVHVTHYSFLRDAFDFDSSYRFSTLAGIQSTNNNLVKERFMALPDGGFMLLKEYGRNFSQWYNTGNYDRPWDAEFLLASQPISNTPVNFLLNPNGYSRYNNTTASNNLYARGDLSMFYFPGRPADSCWSGLINKKQITELNAPALSYLCVPREDGLFFLYNSVERDEYPFGCTLVLDPQGNLVSDREVIAWKSDQSLIFQQSMQITSNEVIVPYANNQQRGFAVFRF
ncbi:MAG: hypothetical protein ABIQ88_09070 [Chitinophagaceae bacterium]